MTNNKTRSGMKILRGIAALAWLLIVASPASVSASSIVVTSPSNGQTFTGNEFTISGVADADATIILSSAGSIVASAVADNTGSWTANISGLPDGNNTISAKSYKNSGLAYFVSPGSTSVLNQFRFSDNALNPNSPYPVDINGQYYVAGAVPGTDTAYIAGGSEVPLKISLANPTSPQPVIDYSTIPGTSTSIGAYSADGSKFYIARIGSNMVSVIDVATNTWIKDIDTGRGATVAMLGPDGDLYVGGGGRAMSVIDEETDTVTRQINVPCTGADDTVPSIIFSHDPTFPYYYASCVNDLTLHQYRVSDDALVATFEGLAASTAVFSPDGSRIFLSLSSAFGNEELSKTVNVIDARSGALIKALQLTHGAIGFFQSPDFRHVYAGTPGVGFDQTGYDIIDMQTDSIQHIETNSLVVAVTSSVTQATLSNVNVAVVLGVKTNSSQLAKTGVFVAIASPMGLFMVAAALYTFTDYRRHKQPLLEMDPSVSYSYFHHLKVVSVPLVRYRLSVSVDRKVGERSDDIHHY